MRIQALVMIKAKVEVRGPSCCQEQEQEQEQGTPPVVVVVLGMVVGHGLVLMMSVQSSSWPLPPLTVVP